MKKGPPLADTLSAATPPAGGGDTRAFLGGARTPAQARENGTHNTYSLRVVQLQLSARHVHLRGGRVDHPATRQAVWACLDAHGQRQITLLPATRGFDVICIHS